MPGTQESWLRKKLKDLLGISGKTEGPHVPTDVEDEYDKARPTPVATPAATPQPTATPGSSMSQMLKEIRDMESKKSKPAMGDTSMMTEPGPARLRRKGNQFGSKVRRPKDYLNVG